MAALTGVEHAVHPSEALPGLIHPEASVIGHYDAQPSSPDKTKARGALRRLFCTTLRRLGELTATLHSQSTAPVSSEAVTSDAVLLRLADSAVTMPAARCLSMLPSRPPLQGVMMPCLST